MDKSELYYFVQKGTNIQAVTRETKKVIIVKADAVDGAVKNWPAYEAITIEEYERKFEIGTDGDENGKD